MGILAAAKLLAISYPNTERAIGYIARNRDSFTLSEINAFAVGVSLIDPECKVKVEYLAPDSLADRRLLWKRHHVNVYADFDCAYNIDMVSRAGVFLLEGRREIFLGKPFFNWGKYYLQIINTVLLSTKDCSDNPRTRDTAPSSYWFGLSTGVVDISLGDVPEQTKKLLSFMKSAMISGGMDPFSGELYARGEEQKQNDAAVDENEFEGTRKMTMADIAVMDWLNANVEVNEEQ